MAKKKPKLNSREEVNQVLHQMAKLLAGLKAAEVKYNKGLQELKKTYEADIAVDTEAYKILEKEVRGYCNYYKKDITTQAIEKVTFGKFGFRKNPAKVLLLNKKDTWEKVKDRAKDLFKKKFVHTEETFNKELALRLFSKKQLKEEDLTSMGVKISQGKTFVCEPDWTKFKKTEKEK